MFVAGVLALSLTGCGGSSTPATRPTLTVTAANASRVYGAANPTFTASATGALPGDTFTFTESTVATPSSPAGTYSIVPVATGANLANYNVVYVNGTLTVNKASLTVTPNNQTIAFESVLPTLTATITGFVNGDPASCRYRRTGTIDYRNLLLSGRLLPDYRYPRDSRCRQLHLYLRHRHAHHHSGEQSRCQLYRQGNGRNPTYHRRNRPGVRRRYSRKRLFRNSSFGKSSYYRLRRGL